MTISLWSFFALAFSLFHKKREGVDLDHLKDTLMQILKFHYMPGSIYKQYPENFAFLGLRILDLS